MFKTAFFVKWAELWVFPRENLVRKMLEFLDSFDSEPRYRSWFPPSYISDLFFSRGDDDFLNAYAINLNEINVIIKFV
jgi:hypothetical protein